ncbi:hypothetical protein LAZ67_12003162 [Cordylochernes scorpioides]|uniref:Serpin domain-containing protein n=1 Tax=Cordylochernes scorpioides TaxID=51811 RepID=A0ABY6L320_9ARAC|nr:hypothetical protein LAZ67_12003162 [Cordylochernes scorpioides]
MPGHRKRRQFKQTDAFTRDMVIGLKRAGWSIRKIAADTHLGASTVHRLWRRWLEQGNVAIYRNVGATRVTSARVDRRILRQAVAAPQATCTAILQHVQDTLDHSISTRTISRRLVANGLHSCRPLRRLPLTPPNRRQRLEWCRARSTWMTEWHRVVFSDESRFCLSSDSRRVRVWRRRGERSNPAAIVERPTVRQRGIMVWGAIAYDSRSPLLRIQGTMTAQRYVDVLRPVTLPYLQGVPNALYQQDNARPHTARISQQALQDVQMLPWPTYSPDLSPIEHVLDIIGRRLHALPQPRSEDELWQMVEREWRAIPQDAIRTLIDSLPRRVAACIAVRELQSQQHTEVMQVIGFEESEEEVISTSEIKGILGMWERVSQMKLFLTLLVLTCACKAEDNLARVSNNFNFQLYQHLKDTSTNLFYSPFSIYTSLAMVYGGSRGTTSETFNRVLGLNSLRNAHQEFKNYLDRIESSKDEYTLDIANGALIRKDFGVSDYYRNFLRSYYGAIVKEIDQYSSGSLVDEVNSWVRQKTHNKISSLVDEISPNTQMILLNAVYFKGTWKTIFDTSDTKVTDFYNHDNQVSQVPLMHVKSKFPHYYGNGYQAIELPYKGNDISMIVVLPTERDGLEHVENKLDADEFKTILSRLYETKVILYLPKFKTEYSESLNEELRKLGLGEIFSPSADLSGIVDHGSVYVSDVLHKAVVEVNEEGSEAAAVTGVVINRMRPSLGDEPTVFRADHPFLFYIIDNRSDLVLFSGRIKSL